MREKGGSGSGRPGDVSRRPAYLRGTGEQREHPGTSPKVEKNSEEATKEAGQRGAVLVEEKDEVLLTWRVWLLPRNPLKSAVVVFSLAGVIALAYWAVPSWIFVLLIAMLLLNRLAPYIFPVKYELTDATVSFKTYLASNTKMWKQLFCYREYPDGVMLMHDPRTVTGRMREGIFLSYDEELVHKDEILRIVSSKLKPVREALSGRPEATTINPRGGLFSAISRIRRLRRKNPPGESSPD